MPTRPTYRGMLNLKIIWSATASIGLAWGLIEGVHGRPLGLWGGFGIFVVFHLIWVYWRVRLGRQMAA